MRIDELERYVVEGIPTDLDQIAQSPLSRADGLRGVRRAVRPPTGALAAPIDELDVLGGLPQHSARPIVGSRTSRAAPDWCSPRDRQALDKLVRSLGRPAHHSCSEASCAPCASEASLA